MKIIFLTDDFPPQSFGGAGIVAYDFARELRQKQNEVFVITTVREKSEEKEEECEGLKIFRIYSNYHNKWQAYMSLHNPQTVPVIEKIIKEIKPDIVHAHNIHQHLSYRCLKIAKKYVRGVFLTTHDVMLFNYGKLMPQNGRYLYRVGIIDQIKEAKKRYNPFRNIIIRHYLKYVTKIFSVSNSLKELLEINNIRNVETIYNGINLNEWQIDKEKIEKFKEKCNLNDKKIIIFSARLIEAKGGDQLMQALALVNKKFPGFLLLVIGKEWAYTEKMKKMSNELSIKEKIIFLGLIDREKLKVVYNSSDISVFPSLCFESFGMGNLEAMACKKPVVSSWFGGPKEVVIDKETGYLIDPNNIELMAEKIIELLKDSKKSKTFGEKGYERVRKNFSLEKQVEETLKRYKQSL